MQIAAPAAPGTIAAARTYLDAAQMATAGARSESQTDPLGRTSEAIRNAELAATELLTAEPRSKYQDLLHARTQVLQGAALLHQAAALFATGSADDAGAARDAANDAWLIFEDVWDVLDND